MRIAADRDLCIGAGLCVLSAGEVFDHDDDGLTVVLAEVPDEAQYEAVREAAALCPSGALTLSGEGAEEPQDQA
ncbi:MULTISPECIES: ferredoxin [unclassified Streptomyces]|uniref:ferredoxin n=1 Tax=unclassified Streptomyces TaxID=2593676 RepID=UPI002034241F|nr:(4Fe-4S)-binding protein [Streptomyces sp. RKAG290]MCM2410694.1 (4Fe-4S)-binding protein [Streptomyces sp. RKAG290]